MTKGKRKSRMLPWIRECLDEIDSEKNTKKKRKDEKNAGMREIKKAIRRHYYLIILFFIIVYAMYVCRHVFSLFEHVRDISNL